MNWSIAGSIARIRKGWCTPHEGSDSSNKSIFTTMCVNLCTCQSGHLCILYQFVYMKGHLCTLYQFVYMKGHLCTCVSICVHEVSFVYMCINLCTIVHYIHLCTCQSVICAHVFVYQFVYIKYHMCTCACISLCTWRVICVHMCQLVYMKGHLCTRISISVTVSRVICVDVCQFVYMSVRSFVYMCVNLSSISKTSPFRTESKSS